MRMYFKQRLFSWFDSYDIYDEAGNVMYTVKGQFAWGHCLKIFDACGNEIGTLQERVFTLLPKFEIYLRGQYAGCITKEFSFLKPKFNIDYNGWYVEGNFWGWDYQVYDTGGRCVAEVSKQLLNWTDTYVIDIQNPWDALGALLLVLAIDAEKCSNGS